MGAIGKNSEYMIG